MFEARVHRTLVTLIAVACTLVGSASAQSSVTVEPLRIVVNPTPGFGVEVRVDKDQTGRRTPVYYNVVRVVEGRTVEVGDPIHLSVRVTEDAYVYLFNVTSDGTVYQFFPNRFSGAANRVRAGQTLRVPPPSSAGYNLTVGPPYGVDKVIAVASRRPLDTSTLAAFSSEFAPDSPQASACRVDCFASSDLDQGGLAQALSIVVTPLPQADWVTDTVQFQIRRR